MAYKEPERMRFYVCVLFGGADPSVGLPYASSAERKRWAQHWWEREANRGREGDRGWIMDVYPGGQVVFKSIQECYQDGRWETDPPGTKARELLNKLEKETR